jgi:hypothetical protein
MRCPEISMARVLPNTTIEALVLQQQQRQADQITQTRLLMREQQLAVTLILAHQQDVERDTLFEGAYARGDHNLPHVSEIDSLRLALHLPFPSLSLQGPFGH